MVVIEMKFEYIRFGGSKSIMSDSVIPVVALEGCSNSTASQGGAVGKEKGRCNEANTSQLDRIEKIQPSCGQSSVPTESDTTRNQRFCLAIVRKGQSSPI